MIVSAQKEMKMSQIYYSRKIEDKAIEALIESLPFGEIRN